MNTGREVESCVRIFKLVLIQVKNILPPLFALPGLFFSPWITAALMLSSVLQHALHREAAPGPGRCSAHLVASFCLLLNTLCLLMLALCMQFSEGRELPVCSGR